MVEKLCMEIFKLIYNSKIIVTRNSSAITYAIEFYKPLMFIYTEEI